MKAGQRMFCPIFCTTFPAPTIVLVDAAERPQSPQSLALSTFRPLSVCLIEAAFSRYTGRMRNMKRNTERISYA